MIVMYLVIFLVAGFWPAGRFNLPFFWAVLIAETLVSVIGIRFISKDLIAERMRPRGEDRDRWGKTFIIILYLLPITIAGFDVGRWHISDTVPLVLQIIGVLMVIAGYNGLCWGMHVNDFFSSAIRLQPDRGQRVINTGPYAIVRHPGYISAAVALIGQSLALGSWLSLLPVLPIIAICIRRTLLEEQMLSKDLPGYADYMQTVRYRWIPGIW